MLPGALLLAAELPEHLCELHVCAGPFCLTPCHSQSLDQGCCAGDGCNLNGGWKMGRSELFWLGPFVSFCVALVMG
eukprot:420322-Hanusia_phi.AAC.1